MFSQARPINCFTKVTKTAVSKLARLSLQASFTLG
jgi:hypothetical protein